MTQTRDLCGLSGTNRIESYGRAELFLYLIGAGVTRSLYMLTAEDAETRASLFDLRLEADTGALAARAGQAGLSADDQVIAMAFDYARRIVDSAAYPPGAHFRLLVTAQGDGLLPDIFKNRGIDKEG
ncbi:MAG: hypothetical protein HY023_09065 [Chloroflexi bacterium]|nr:hypothetical protein [Chloroflexota bacterium]